MARKTQKETENLRPLIPPKIFVVHGRDERYRRAVVDFLKNLGTEPIVLAEKPTGGRIIIEKFEYYASEADYAIVLLTPDDVGSLNKKLSKQQARARQNVLFELGYFLARLGRGKVFLLSSGDIEMPSDLHGIVFISLDNFDDWGWEISRELEEAGIIFDLESQRTACQYLYKSRKDITGPQQNDNDSGFQIDDKILGEFEGVSFDLKPSNTGELKRVENKGDIERFRIYKEGNDILINGNSKLVSDRSIRSEWEGKLMKMSSDGSYVFSIELKHSLDKREFGHLTFQIRENDYVGHYFSSDPNANFVSGYVAKKIK